MEVTKVLRELVLILTALWLNIPHIEFQGSTSKLTKVAPQLFRTVSKITNIY